MVRIYKLSLLQLLVGKWNGFSINDTEVVHNLKPSTYFKIRTKCYNPYTLNTHQNS